MATIVIHKKTGKRYALLGTGFGAFQSKKPNWLLGNLMADESQGQFAMVCVARKDGSIRWVESNAVSVESVDGVPLADVFQSDAPD